MPPGGAEFVALLGEGEPVTEATKAALTAEPRFDLSGNLAELIGAGVFVDYSFGGEAGSQEFGTGA